MRGRVCALKDRLQRGFMQCNSSRPREYLQREGGGALDSILYLRDVSLCNRQHSCSLEGRCQLCREPLARDWTSATWHALPPLVGDQIDVRASKKRLLILKSLKHDVPRNPGSGGLAALRIKASL